MECTVAFPHPAAAPSCLAAACVARRLSVRSFGQDVRLCSVAIAIDIPRAAFRRDLAYAASVRRNPTAARSVLSTPTGVRCLLLVPCDGAFPDPAAG